MKKNIMKDLLKNHLVANHEYIRTQLESEIDTDIYHIKSKLNDKNPYKIAIEKYEFSSQKLERNITSIKDLQSEYQNYLLLAKKS